MDPTLTAPRGDFTRSDVLDAYSRTLQLHVAPGEEQLAEAIITESIGEGDVTVVSAPTGDVIERLDRIAEDVRDMVAHLQSLMCDDCGRRMDLGDLHTATCAEALRQDAEDGDSAALAALGGETFHGISARR